MSSDSLFDDFEAEMKRYGAVLVALEKSNEFCSFRPVESASLEEGDAEFLVAANSLNEAYRDAQSGIPVLRGSMLVQSLSRFEAFVRQEVEDLAVRASTNAKKFSLLPREMRENLTLFAANVLASPKKYRMEKHVTSIARVMARNLEDASEPGEINQYCMSLTHENMRSATVDDLFARFGLKDIWKRIGADTQIQTLLEQPNPEQAASACQKRLNIAVERRNGIAHSAGNITWPSENEVRETLDLLTALGGAMSRLVPVYEIQLRAVSTALAEKATDAAGASVQD